MKKLLATLAMVVFMAGCANLDPKKYDNVEVWTVVEYVYSADLLKSVCGKPTSELQVIAQANMLVEKLAILEEGKSDEEDQNISAALKKDVDGFLIGKGKLYCEEYADQMGKNGRAVLKTFGSRVK